MRGGRVVSSGPAGAALLVAALAGCSSGSSSVFDEVGTLVRGGRVEEARPARLTRAAVERIPYAAIAISVDGGPRAVLAPIADNDGYLNYRDASGNAIVMYGNAVAGTGSLGQDLLAVRFDRQDPIAHPTPLAGWPGRLHREYQFAVRDLEPESVVLDCLLEARGRETVEIVQVRYDLVRVDEVCTEGSRQVTNRYWVEDGTGFVWKSEQWLGPVLGRYTIEILRPYEG